MFNQRIVTPEMPKRVKKEITPNSCDKGRVKKQKLNSKSDHNMPEFLSLEENGGGKVRTKLRIRQNQN